MKLTNKHILAFILLIAFALRFYHFFEIPFTFDELSALYRTQFDSFKELIEKGVIIDGHPAGIQVFLYYWTKWLGQAEWLVKLPFTLMGIASVYLIYLIGKRWFNETVGLLTAAMLASTQFMVMYSQIARPYISGLFFCLGMVYYWTKLMQQPERKFVTHSVFYILFSSLCSYNHHFSLLLAAIVGFTGLFLIPKKHLIKYIVFGILIFVLYIPHLHIFFYQLHVGGIEGWLGKPRPEFFSIFVFYLFNYSWLMALVALVLSLFGWIDLKKSAFEKKYIFIAIVWFLMPLLIGYFYSVYVNGVLQFSVVIFSHAFLYLALWGVIRSHKIWVNGLLVLLILSLNSYSLIFQRKHYDLFYHSPIKEIVLEHQKIKTQKDSVLSIIDSDLEMTQLYMERYQTDTSFIWFPNLPLEKDLSALLNQKYHEINYVYIGCMSGNNPNTVPLIQDYFPTVVWQKNFAGGTCYLFSKEPSQTKPWVAFFNFEQTGPSGFTTPEAQQLADSISFSGKTSYFMDSTHEWSLNFSCQLNPIMKNENNFIDISLMTKIQDSFTDAVLVATIETVDGKQVYWGGASFQKFVPISRTPNTWIPVHHSIKLSDVPLVNDEMVLRTYVWNLKHQQFFIDDYGILVRDGNPVIYSLLENFNK